MKETEPIKNGERVIESKTAVVRTLKTTTGYPFNLTESQVTRLIYFFGSRKAGQKAMKSKGKGPVRFTHPEWEFLKEAFEWFGFVNGTEAENIKNYMAVVLRFKKICDFLRTRPAYITTEIRNALDTGGYKGVLKNIVMVIDKHGQVQPRLISDEKKKSVIPFGKMEEMLWNIQSVTLDKIQMIVDSITPSDVKKATLGNKSKAIRDLYSMLHMAKMANKNPNMTLVNVNVNTADTKEKMDTYGQYITRNRQERNGV